MEGQHEASAGKRREVYSAVGDYVVAAGNLPFGLVWFGFGIAQTLRLNISSVEKCH